MHCRACGNQISNAAQVCPICGALQGGTKYCMHCGGIIAADCIICPICGRQVDQLRPAQPQIVINNDNTNMNTNVNYPGRYGREKNKWVAFLLCLFLGYLGFHKFYEEKVGMGVLYLFTGGLLGIGWFVDTIALLFKPNPYYV